MNNSRLFLTIFVNHGRNAAKSLRNFHSARVLNSGPQGNVAPEYPGADNSLFFTNLPNKRRERRVRTEKLKLSHGSLVIDCKHKELNHYSGMHFGKFEVVPLASKGWAHRKSKGDFFTILPTKKYSPFTLKEGSQETFEGCGVSKEVIEQLKKINVIQPTGIQAKVLEKLLSGENLLMFAECGSGKTLGYIIAMIENILKWKQHVPTTPNSPLGIIVTASRELAVQVVQLASSLASDLGLKCQALVDGNSYELLQQPQPEPVDILVCNANVMNKHLARGIYSTKYCKHVVIDDADSFEMANKFERIQRFLNISKLLYTGLSGDEMAENRAQICFVSSVAPSTLEGKLNEIIKMSGVPVVSTPYLHKVLCTVPQRFIRVTGGNMVGELLKIGKSSVKNKIPTIIFSNVNKTCNWSAIFLKENGVECVTVNKRDKPYVRLENLRSFELGFVNVLCTTNLLSLGCHFPKVKHIVSLQFPRFMTDYIHRCGRVGRLGQAEDCLITNFIKTSGDVELVQKIEKAVRTNTALPSIRCPRVRCNLDD